MGKGVSTFRKVPRGGIVGIISDTTYLFCFNPYPAKLNNLYFQKIADLCLI